MIENILIKIKIFKKRKKRQRCKNFDFRLAFKGPETSDIRGSSIDLLKI